jgi:ATP/maltotriose-dependent transcriptional regulator MalT/DNA-binding SARP family transcriptional activator
MWQGMVDRLRLARVSGVGLYDYLAQQVLEQQSPQVRDFLLRTAYLEEFDVELCKDILGPGQDWSRLIESVLQNNLFVLPVGEDGRWIRFHHLFRDFLQARLEQEYPDQKETILRKISQVYAERGEWEKVFSICQRIGDVRMTAQMIEKAGTQLISNGRMSILNDWLNSIPGDLLATYPALLSIKGVLLASQGKGEQSLALLHRAVQAQRANKEFANLALTLVRRATAYRFQGRYQESNDDALEALNLAKSDPGLRLQKAEALRTLGINLYYLGRLNDAIDRYTQSLGIYEALGDQQNIAMLLMELGLVFMNTGRYTHALNYYQQSLEYWRRAHNHIRTAMLYNNLAVLYHLMGNYTQAAGFYEDGLTQARRSNNPRTEAYILSGIGDLYADLRAFGAASEAYQQAREIARQIDYRFLLIYVDLAEAAQSRRMGDLAQARLFLESAARMTQEGRSEFEQALYALEAGQIDRLEEKLAEAIRNIENASLVFEKGGHRVEAARSVFYLAFASLESGDSRIAVERLKHAFQLAADLDSQHVLVVAGQEAISLLETAMAEPFNLQLAESLLQQVRAFQGNIPSLRRRVRPHVAAIPFAPPKLTIRAFGKIQVELDGVPVTAVEWQNQKKVREFLFYLLANPNGMMKEEIGAVFWPESSQAQLKLQFKNTIYRVRYALGQDVILLLDDTYRFNRHMDYEYDVEIFVNKIDQAHKAQSHDEKVTLLREATGIYKGPYLWEIDSSWATVERERLWQMNVEASLELARICLENGDFHTTLEYSQHLLMEDPCLEEAHRLAMRAYAAKGNRAGVKRQYESCKQALMDEIQSAPSPQTSSLYDALRS